MASISINLHYLLLSTFFLIQLTSSLLLPLTKHPQTNQHLTQIYHSSQLTPTNLVLDLNSPFLYLSLSSNNQSPVIPRHSIKCSALGFDQFTQSHEDCKLPLQNPVTGETSLGKLVHDLVVVDNRFPGVDEFHYVYATSNSLTGLASSARGVLGLGRNRVGVVEQVSHSFGLSNKFSLCLSSSENGVILFGDNYNYHGIEGFNSMVYTPMGKSKSKSNSYHINFSSLKVQNKKLNLVSTRTIKFSTVQSNMIMESKIYKEFRTAFAVEAELMGMIRVNPVGKYELCYKLEENYKKVPVIELVLQSELVKWRINGKNSMVKVSDELMCLGILNGGNELGCSIVMGSNQLEDNLVEFDLGRSMIGFTSLAIKQTSCSFLASSLRKSVQSL